MLHDLADECDVSIVDVDAIATDLGGSEHVPDGTHHSATMQAMVRSEILEIDWKGLRRNCRRPGR
jgi:hypothetical protein